MATETFPRKLVCYCAREVVKCVYAWHYSVIVTAEYKAQTIPVEPGYQPVATQHPSHSSNERVPLVCMC